MHSGGGCMGDGCVDSAVPIWGAWGTDVPLESERFIHALSNLTLWLGPVLDATGHRAK